MSTERTLDRSDTQARRFSLALRAARAGAWEWNIKTNQALWSPENYAVLGLPPGEEQASYDDWMARVHPDDREMAEREVTRAVEAKGDLDFEYRAVWPDGTIRWIRDVGKMMFGDDGEPVGMYGIQIDVTETRLLKERLRKSERFEAMGRVAGSVAHDFNNLLTVITGYAELLESQLGEDQESRPMLQEVAQAAERAADLTAQLLAFGRRQVLSPRALDLNDLIREKISLLEHILGESIELGLQLAPGPVSIVADGGQVEQILLNLTVNARDAMPDGGTLTLRTWCMEADADVAGSNESLAPGRYGAFSLKDSGLGMDAETLASVFEPFFTTKSPEKGTGLGLASAHGIARQSGGDIAVESEPGRGTVFTVFLPQAADGAHVETPAMSALATLAGHETILVVEDNTAILELIGRVLGDRGYRVLAASSAEEAREVVERLDAAVDLLLTDVVLPKMSGAQLAAELAQSATSPPVIFMTGYGHDVLQPQQIAAEGTNLLRKPFTPTELLAKIRGVLG